MSKELYVLRHAKAEEKVWDQADLYRKLTERGQHDAQKLGQQLKEKSLIPEFMIVSSADRAQQTKDHLVQSWEYPVKCVNDQNLYLATWKQYDERIARVDDQVSRLLIIGHNPDLMMLVTEYSKTFIELPTCGLVRLSFNAQKWSEVGFEQGQVQDVWTPKYSWDAKDHI